MKRDDLFYPFQQLFDKFYDDFWSEDHLTLSGVKGKVGFPRWDVVRDDRHWWVEVSLPGMEPDDVKAEIVPGPMNQRTLKISGRISEDHRTGDGVTYLRRELRRSAFERSMYLPDEVVGEPEATMKNGILKLLWTLPEKQKSESKQIEIKKLDADP